MGSASSLEVRACVKPRNCSVFHVHHEQVVPRAAADDLARLAFWPCVARPRTVDAQMRSDRVALLAFHF
jgi:hypothetical protein